MRMTTRLIAMLLIVGGAAQAETNDWTPSPLQAAVEKLVLKYYEKGLNDGVGIARGVGIGRVVTNYVTVTQECTRQHWPIPGQSTPLPLFPNTWPSNFNAPYYSTVTTRCFNVESISDHIPMMMSIGSNGVMKAIPNPNFREPDLSCGSKLSRREMEDYWRTNDAGDVEK